MSNPTTKEFLFRKFPQSGYKSVKINRLLTVLHYEVKYTLTVFEEVVLRGFIIPIFTAIFVNIGFLMALPYVGRGMEKIFFVRSYVHKPLIVSRLPRKKPAPAPKIKKRKSPSVKPIRRKVQKLKTAQPLSPAKIEKSKVDMPLPSPPRFGLNIKELLPIGSGPPVQSGNPLGSIESRRRKGATGKRNRGVVLIRSAYVSYPQWALEQGIEGRVVVRMLVDESGRVIRAKVSKTSGYASLDEAALNAVKGYRFLPALQNGKPVKRWVEQEFVFKIER